MVRTRAAVWEDLYRSMEYRGKPEDVAEIATDLMPSLKTILAPAARHAWGLSSAFPGFRGHAINVSILARFPGLPSEPEAAVSLLRNETGLVSGDLRDRMPAPIRKQAGIKISRRQYMKRCRILLALERKLNRLIVRGRFVRWTRVALSAWAIDISLSDFMTLTPESRVFLAYYVARRQRQSTFSGTGQDSAWDTVASQLFELTTPSLSIARVYPHQSVLEALSNAERTQLLLDAYLDLTEMATALDTLWTLLDPDRDSMIVRRGMNSSDWNLLAGAWNAIRRLWISLLYACDLDDQLDIFCPGKAMRLMAADVAAWHRRLGDDEGPDVKVFKQLALGWHVLLGRDTCTRSDVLLAIKRAGVKDTWTRPMTSGRPVPTKLTQPLVHGVPVSDPVLADVLRRAGWFSGKGRAEAVPGLKVDRDKHGFAVGVSSAKERTALNRQDAGSNPAHHGTSLRKRGA